MYCQILKSIHASSIDTDGTNNTPLPNMTHKLELITVREPFKQGINPNITKQRPDVISTA